MKERKSDYRALLFELAVPGRGTTSAGIQQQLSAEKELAEGVDMMAPLDLDDEVHNPLPVPPAAAPEQVYHLYRRQVVSEKRDQRCCYGIPSWHVH